MAVEIKELAQYGILGLLGTVITVLFAKRAGNKVATDNARANRESRFEDNLQARYEAAMGKISQLHDEIEVLRGKLAEADKRLTIVQMLSDGDPTRAVEITRDSAFIDLTRPIKPRQHDRPSAHDPFQAADPYAPKPRKPK